MGLFDELVVEDGVELPKFPQECSPTEIEWQTKEIGRPAMQTYKLASSGRLLRRQREYRQKTPAEKHEAATNHGFDSWDEYVAFCETQDAHGLIKRGISVGGPNEQTVDEEFWGDHNMHGSFEFHGSSDDIEAGFSWSYEARFTRGDLDAIVFLGERGGGEPSDYKPDEPTTVQF
ncbi:hypothetical protein PNP85_06230 [Halobacterium salinarum]|nr:hypothetical protein [Halobacterium salinarum]